MRARLGLALFGTALLLSAAPAPAQSPVTAQESPADALSRNLRMLAQNPKSVSALMGAGMAALQVGDAQAALSFFARAEEQLPRDGRIKMWMGSALVQLEQPQGAMKFFSEASELGVSENDIARDRGLAWDIMGDQRRAQRDYQLALRKGPDPEVTRRLALSFAISGDRERALQLLEEQLLVQDRAALRTRALVLALTGDAAGASRAVEQSLPAGQAAVMAPFLARLPALSPADRALAVHLGHFPTPGRPSQPPQTYAANPYPGPAASPPAASAPSNQYASVDAATRAGTPDRGQPALGGRTPPPPAASSAPRRRPGAEEQGSRSVGRALAGYSIADPQQQRPAPSSTPPQRSLPAQPAPAQPAPAQSAPTQPTPLPAPPVRVAEAAPVTAPVQRSPEPGFANAPQNPPGAAARPPAVPPAAETRASPPPRPTPVRTAEARPPAPAAKRPEAPAPRRGRVADLAGVLEELDESATPAARGKAASRGTQLAARDSKGGRDARGATGRDAKGAADKDRDTRKGRAAANDEGDAGAGKSKKKGAAPAREPSRVWVQVAGGANKESLPRAYASVKAKAPKLLGSRTAWTVPNRATNRILVGPFASSDEAQDFVNKLAKEDVGAFTFTSEAGQKVERLPPK